MVMKDQLKELLAAMKGSKTKKRAGGGSSKKNAKKKKDSFESSDSDNSVHALDNTPDPSDDEDTASRVQRFICDEAEDSDE